MNDRDHKNSSHIYQFEGADGMQNMQQILKMFRFGFKSIGGIEVESVSASDVIEYRLAGGSSVVIKPIGDEPELAVDVSIAGDNKETADETEKRVYADLGNIMYMHYRAGYCCE